MDTRKRKNKKKRYYANCHFVNSKRVRGNQPIRCVNITSAGFPNPTTQITQFHFQVTRMPCHWVRRHCPTVATIFQTSSTSTTKKFDFLLSFSWIKSLAKNCLQLHWWIQLVKFILFNQLILNFTWNLHFHDISSHQVLPWSVSTI